MSSGLENGMFRFFKAWGSGIDSLSLWSRWASIVCPCGSLEACALKPTTPKAHYELNMSCPCEHTTTLPRPVRGFGSSAGRESLQKRPQKASPGWCRWKSSQASLRSSSTSRPAVAHVAGCRWQPTQGDNGFSSTARCLLIVVTLFCCPYSAVCRCHGLPRQQFRSSGTSFGDRGVHVATCDVANYAHSVVEIALPPWFHALHRGIIQFSCQETVTGDGDVLSCLR